MEVVNREDVEKFINFLFEPEDIFETRVKYAGEHHAISHYITPERRQMFVETHLPIHDARKAHVWVGVGPREKVGSTNPAVNRVLWCDFADVIDSQDKVEAALRDSGLPWPSMIVNSGNGFHAYWKLSEALEPSETRKYSKGVHGRLPTDNTHDPTRVMRLPGTRNWKDPEDPKMSFIVEATGQIHDVTSFPKVEMDIGATVQEREVKQLDLKSKNVFLSHWLDGQKHSVAVAVAGFLRKDRLFNRSETANAIKDIHQLAGFQWDANLQKVVDDTYSKPFSQVAGRSMLYDLGITPPEQDLFTIPVPQVKTPKISVIDFTQDIPEQEFWVDGLVGPGLTTLWAAAPKSGKSFCAMQMGYALAKGQSLWGMNVPEKKKVLYFQGELSRGMVYARAIGMFGKGNIPSPREFAMTDRPEETLTLNDNPEVLLDLAEHYDVIIVDPLSAFNGNDENSYTSVRETLAIFDSLKAQGKAVVLVHHTRKMADGEIPSAADARGSGLWISAADAIVMQQKTESGNVNLYFTLRAAPDKDPLQLYRLPHGGFTHDRDMYLATNPNPTLRLDMVN